MNPMVNEIRAMLALFVKSPYRDLHLRSGAWEMFLAKPDGAANPMHAAIAAASSVSVDAPHLGLFHPCVTTGATVEPDTVVAQIEVLGEREDLTAGTCGRISEVLAEDGALIECGMPLIRIAA